MTTRKPRLSMRAIELLRDEAQTARAYGGKSAVERATAIELLLGWYAEAHGDPRATA